MNNRALDHDVIVRLLLVAALSLGFMARAATFRSPLFDFHSWRQADTATIARNFATERFHPLYPQIDARGAQPHGYVETGFEIHAFAVAALSKIAGFRTEFGRLLNVVLFPVAGWLLFRFVWARYDTDTAVIAVTLYALALPLTIYIDRAFMNESILTLLAIACLYSAQQYCAGAGVRHLLTLTVASALIAAVKPTYLIVWAALFGLFYERHRAMAFVRWEPWLAGLVTVATGLLWFAHARTLADMTGLSFGITDKVLNMDLLFNAEYPVKIARRLFADVLGPVVFFAAPLGAIVAMRSGKLAEALGLVAFLGYLVTVAGGNFHHNYYQLPVVPVATVAGAAGIAALAARLAQRRPWQRIQVIAFYAGVLWIAVVSAFARSVSPHNWYEFDVPRQRLCEDVRPRLAPADRVVFVDERSPDVLFCLDRKGWLLNEIEGTASSLRTIARQGGSVVIVHRDNALRPDLDSFATRLVESTDYVIYRMKVE